jgi:hypothetical protein
MLTASQREAQRRYYKRHREMLLAKAAIRNAARTKEQRSDDNRKWRERHPEDAKRRNAEWRAANPEKHRANARRWQIENPERYRANQQRWKTENREQRIAYDRAYYRKRKGVKQWPLVNASLA